MVEGKQKVRNSSLHLRAPGKKMAPLGEIKSRYGEDKISGGCAWLC